MLPINRANKTRPMITINMANAVSTRKVVGCRVWPYELTKETENAM